MFLDGEFIGGIDVVMELIENEEFDDMIPAACKRGSPAEEFTQTVEQSQVTLVVSSTLDAAG